MKSGQRRVIIEFDDDSSHFEVYEQLVSGLVRGGFAPKQEILENLALYADFGPHVEPVETEA